MLASLQTFWLWDRVRAELDTVAIIDPLLAGLCWVDL